MVDRKSWPGSELRNCLARRYSRDWVLIAAILHLLTWPEGGQLETVARTFVILPAAEVALSCAGSTMLA